MTVSFRTRLALLLLGLFILVQLPTFFAFYYAIRQSALTQAEQRLETGGRVFEQGLQARGRQLLDAVEVITSDFAFKQAVATGDTPTIRTVLFNHGQRIHADLAVLSGLNGHIIASIDGHGRVPRLDGWQVLLQKAEQGKAMTTVTLLDGHPYQLVIVPVRAPTRIAWVGMGFALGQSLAGELRDLTQLDVSFLAARPDGGIGAESTLAAGSWAALDRSAALAFAATRHPQIMHLGNDELLSLWRPLGNDSGPLMGAVLQYPLARALAPFRELQRELLLIGLLSLVAALLGAMWLARNVTQPVSRLAEAARRVERGDYLGGVGIERSDELGDLAQAFDNMQLGISRRERQIAHQAFHDSLTELPNRASLQERMDQAIARARRDGKSLAVLMLDIDRFKEINDTMGHAIGDRVLIEMGGRLRRRLRQTDTVARFGGDEFVMLIESVSDRDAVQRLCEQLLDSVSEAVSVDDMELFIDVSVGMALYPEHGDLGEELLRRADIAMYDAKQSNSRLRIYESGRDAAHLYRLSLVHDLRRAVADDELVLFYQPKLALGSGKVTHVEALLRWQHPRHGLIPPNDFIPLAEHSGSIRALTDWVMREVIRQCRAWADDRIDLGVAINLSAMDLGSGDLPELLAGYLAEFDVDAGRLVLEVTETAVMRDAAYSLEVLNRLKACGVHLAIDDFGTGYSSLSHLKRLPVDELKIDKSFVMGMADDEDDAVIVRSTIELAHNMGLCVVAEGVESAVALEMLQSYHCDVVQGYLISRPMPAAQVAAWLQSRKALAFDRA